MRRSLIALLLAGCALAATAPATGRTVFPPVEYDGAVPTPEAVLGHALGARHTRSDEVRRYFEALQRSAPDRMVMGEYGRSWEGRVLPWAAISSAENIARLDRIRADSLALADARRTDPAAARAILARQPVIVWLGYSVHGNEASPSEAAMAVARHLLAARDPRVAEWLNEAVVVIVPTQNPDGRDRFVAAHEAARGLTPDPDPLAAERTEPWPSGRFNHYLFDLNRDWFAQTQPETRGHSALMRTFLPQVVADAHEMGTDTTFFFPPEADPLNPFLPPAQVKSRALFGRAHAAVFDREGVPYFTRENYDAFYPGYGDNWPSWFGAVSMTYEQARTGGLVARRTSGETFSYAEAVRNHVLISLSTIETAAANRERLLADFRAHHEQTIREGRTRGAWLIERLSEDPDAADDLARLLARQGVEVSRADAGFDACGKRYGAGSYVVPAAQPLGRLVDVLFDPTVAMPAAFLAEQERLRAKRLPTEMYDVTAWSLPALFNTPARLCKAAPAAGAPLTPDQIGRGSVSGAESAAAYVVPAGTTATRLLSRALQNGWRMRTADEAFTLGGVRYPSGSIVIPRAGNPADLPARLQALAAETGARVTASPDTWVTDGPSLGSSRMATMPAPRIALAWDRPTAPTSAGSVRHLIEREYGYPVTAIRTANLLSADLSRFDVLILPDGGGWKAELGAGGMANLRDWVRKGGVLVGLGRAVEMMADPDAEMLAARRETLPPPEKKEPERDPKKATTPGSELKSEADYLAAIRPGEVGPDPAPGVLALAEVDPDHWLGAGVRSRVTVLADGGPIYTPLKLDQGVNVARYAGPDELLAAGHLWAETRRQMAYKPLVMAQESGAGHLVAFTQDPTARGFQRGLDVLFLNAVFRGPAHSRKLR
jgi:hypothetical protein